MEWRNYNMTHRTIDDLIQTLFIDTGSGPELTDFQILPIEMVINKIEQSDVTLWLSWAGGVLLTEAIKKVKEAIEYNENLNEDMEIEEIVIEELLSDQEKAMLYGAFLITSN